VGGSSSSSPDLPAEQGYRFPAEWEPHAATWLSWPRNRDTWPGKFEPVPAVWAALTRLLAEHEQVHICAGRPEVMVEAERLVGRLKNVTLHDIPTNDAWMRDHGPMFLQRANLEGGHLAPRDVIDLAERDRHTGEHHAEREACNDEIALVDWGYNAWGGKYPPWDEDDRVPERVAAALGMRRFVPKRRSGVSRTSNIESAKGGSNVDRKVAGTLRVPSAGFRTEKDKTADGSQNEPATVVLEGGGVDSNGVGTIVAAENCLLAESRNPGMTRAEMETLLRDYCGAKKVLWIAADFAGDDTDGHVDQIARFVDPTTLVAAVDEDRSSDNYQSLQENLARVREMTDQDGRPLDIVPLPVPRPLYFNGQRLPAGYVNFYIANSLVVAPTFNDPADDRTLGILRELFPDRRVVGQNAVDLVLGLGAFHCITQQQPAYGVR
jgi:agmatine deiminase